MDSTAAPQVIEPLDRKFPKLKKSLNLFKFQVRRRTDNSTDSSNPWPQRVSTWRSYEILEGKESRLSSLCLLRHLKEPLNFTPFDTRWVPQSVANSAGLYTFMILYVLCSFATWIPYTATLSPFVFIATTDHTVKLSWWSRWVLANSLSWKHPQSFRVRIQVNCPMVLFFLNRFVGFMSFGRRSVHVGNQHACEILSTNRPCTRTCSLIGIGNH